MGGDCRVGSGQRVNLPGPGKLGPIAGKEGAAALLKAAAWEGFLPDQWWTWWRQPPSHPDILHGIQDAFKGILTRGVKSDQMVLYIFKYNRKKICIYNIILYIYTSNSPRALCEMRFFLGKFLGKWKMDVRIADWSIFLAQKPPNCPGTQGPRGGSARTCHQSCQYDGGEVLGTEKSIAGWREVHRRPVNMNIMWYCNIYGYHVLDVPWEVLPKCVLWLTELI